MSTKNAYSDLDCLFNPKSLALIGASTKPNKWGCIILSNIITCGYKGKLYPINPKHDTILGLHTYPNLDSVPDEIDVAMVATPISTTLEVIKECGEKRVKFAVVISAGFSEAGQEGERLESEMVQIARGAGVRIVGPNTMGVFGAKESMSALMPRIHPSRGGISFISQSGNIGTQLLGLGEKMGIGFSKFVSSGNEADVRCEEYLEYFGNDPETKAVMIYMEGLDDGRTFLDVAKEVTRKKPVVVFKSGKTTSGSRAAKSHTGSLAGSMEIYGAAFKQSGIIEVSTTTEMLDIANAFVHLPLPRGNRTGIVSWGGGWGVVTADACEGAGLRVPDLPEDAVDELNAYLPPYWSKNNPIDLVGTLDMASHRKCLEALVKCRDIDGVICLGIVFDSSTSGMNPAVGQFDGGIDASILSKVLEKSGRRLTSKITKLMNRYNKPVIVVTISHSDALNTKLLKEGIIAYGAPEKAASTMHKLFEYKRYLSNQEQDFGK